MDEELYHYGIKGMKWGVRRYQRPDGRYTPAGKERYSKNSVESKKHLELSDNQKKVLKTGLAIGGAALVAYGGYKVYKNNPQAIKDFTNNLLKKESGVVAKTSNGTLVKKISESKSDSLQRSNPSGNKKNCPICSMVGVLRQNGVNCTAKPCDDKFQTPDALTMIRECFPGCKTIPKTVDGAATAVKFGKSRKDAEAMLIKNFGENAKGLVGFQWGSITGALDGAGHVISFDIKDGVCTFDDFQTGKECTDSLWKMINKNGILQIASFGDIEPDYDALEKYVDF